MADIREVINDLDCCLEGLCDACSHKNSDAPGGCKDELMYHAMLILQAQEPRVMSLEEAQAALHTETVVWTECEEKNGDKLLYVGLHMNGTDYFTMQDDSVIEETDLDGGMGAELYGKKYRFWTSQPTDEQMEATLW